MSLPNTFIIGAPKCGTTSLSVYLGSHPQVFVCTPKEPQYWSKDITEADNYGLRNTADYLQLFKSAKPAHKIIIDASTNYLWSNVAIDNILEFNPAARFIVMLRNPVDIAHGYHMEMQLSLYENITSFEEAWSLQPERRIGRSIPPQCSDPQKLDYERIACLGTQVERLLVKIPTQNVLILYFDDLKVDPRSIYLKTLRFLGLADDGRISFPKQNPSRQLRSPRLSRLILRPPGFLAEFARMTRSILWTFGVRNVRQALYRLINPARDRPPLSLPFRQQLTKRFLPEIQLLEMLTSRDLSHWKTYGNSMQINHDSTSFMTNDCSS